MVKPLVDRATYTVLGAQYGHQMEQKLQMLRTNSMTKEQKKCAPAQDNGTGGKLFVDTTDSSKPKTASKQQVGLFLLGSQGWINA